jgi:integrase
VAKRNRELTWEKGRNRWRKKYRGRVYVFPFGKSKSDEHGYQAALEAWHEKKAELDAQGKPHQADYQLAVRLRQEVVNWLLLEQPQASQYDASIDALREDNRREQGWGGPPATFLNWEHEHDRLVRELDKLNRDFQRKNPPPLNQPNTLPIDPIAYKTNREKMLWGERIESPHSFQRWTGTADPDRTIGANLDKFLAMKKGKAEAGQESPGWFNVLSQRLEYFRTFAGGTPVDQLNRTLAGFHGHLLQRVARKEIRPAFACGILTSVKTFVRWLDQQEVIDRLPRNLHSLRITAPPQEVQVFAVEEIETLLANSLPRTRLFFMLMINCGFTQQDVSDLRHDEVDWVSGRIVRKRSKTRTEGNVPVVNYPLWGETFALLKASRSVDPVRVLVTEAGTPLRQRAFRADGKTQNNDMIDSAYTRVCRKLKIDHPKPLKLLRKTGASTLETHPDFGRYAQRYLGHAPTSVADKHYVRPSQEQFDAAVRWLGDQFGIE